MPLPFDGAISAFFKNEAPAAVRALISAGGKGVVMNPDYPYDSRLKRRTYETELANIQIELVKFQTWMRETEQRVVVVFEGRDAAGKGGTIKRFLENLNPRHSKSIALSKPTDREMGELYFQRYIRHLPSAGEMILFDRSWYNRGVVEKVFEFCTDEQREKWMAQVPDFEKLLVNDGIKLTKIWLNVGQATQLKRFLDRENDPLKQWKLSWIDVEGLKRWDAYSNAISETLTKTHTDVAPWTVIKSDDKRRARLNAIRAVLSQYEYAGRDDDHLGVIDPSFCGGPELLNA